MKESKKKSQVKLTSNIGLTPLRDKIIVSPITEEVKTVSGIILAEKESEEKPGVGFVVAVGPGEYEAGKLIPMNITVGTKVLFPPFGVDAVMVDGNKYFVMREAVVLAVFN